MKTTAKGAQRPSSRGRYRLRALGALPVLSIATSAAFFGGVFPESRALVHLLLTLGLLTAASLPDRTLARAGALLPVTGAFGALILAVAVGLVPLPMRLLTVLAPGVAEAHAGRTWWTLSILPERTADELGFFVLLLGIALVTGTWATLRRRRGTVEWVCLIGCAALAATAGAHHLAQESRLFGVFPSGLAPGGFFAPFVDANHFGAAMVLGLPVVFGVVARERLGSVAWLLGVLTGVAGLYLMEASRSRGAAVGLAVAMLGFMVMGSVRQRIVGVTAMAGGLVVVVTGSLQSASGLSLDVRLLAWRAALDGWWGGWFAGTGGGTISWVVDRHRRDTTGYLWGHLHHDPLEWFVETGLLGVAALCVAVVLLAPRRAKDPRAQWWTLGLLALAINSLVEFPLQMPAIAMAATALLVCRLLVFTDPRSVSPRWLRGILLGAAALQLVGAAWSIRSGAVERARNEVMTWHDEPERSREGVDTLRRWAPWRPEIELVEGWEALAGGRVEGALEAARAIRGSHPHDPDALRGAAALAARAGRHEEALEIYARAAAMAPRDWRTSLARARLEHGERAVQHWREAFAHGAPPSFVREAFEHMPVGLVWVDALTQAPAYRQASLARTLASLGEVDAALLAWERARMLDSRGPPHPSHLALLGRAGRLDEAIKLGRDALDAAPDDPLLLETLGELHAARGETDRAVELFLRAGERRPAARSLAVRTLAGVRGSDDALALIRRIDLTGGETGSLHLELARHLAELGDREGCRQQVDRAERKASGRLTAEIRGLRDRCRPLD